MKRMIGFSFILMVSTLSYGMEEMSFLEQTIFVSPPYLLTESTDSLEECKQSMRNFWEGCKQWYVTHILSLVSKRADSSNQKNPPIAELTEDDALN